MTACARQAVRAAGTHPAAIGLSGQMHGLVMTSARGRALRPALLWPDQRALGALRAYQRLDSGTLARLANPLAPGMAGPMLKWIAENEPRTYQAARWALQPKDWLRARLTGKFHAEPSDASATLLYDVPGDRWDLAAVSALGLDASLLAPLLPSSGAPAGQLTARAGTALGLPAGIPVAAGAADTAAAALGSGVAYCGDVQLTVGTGAQVIRPVAAADSRADAGINLYRSAAPEGWYHMGATLSAGLSLNWVRETMNATWDELYASAGHPGEAHDPLFVPHLSGERTPYSDPALRGSWTWLSLADDRTSLLRSALEGTAFAIRDALDALLGGQRPPHLRLAGGGTLAAGWRQLLADVLGLPLYAVDVPAASGRGAALLGARAAGLLSYADIQGPLAPATRLVAEPDPAATAFHAERHARFRRVVAALAAQAPAGGLRARRPRGRDSMTSLTGETLAQLNAGVARPRYDRRDVTTGIVHIGVGNFHRSHQAVYLDTLMNSGAALDWGICGIGLQPSNVAMRDALAAQDGLYTLVLRHGDGTWDPRVIGSIVEYLFAPDDPEAAIEKMAAPATRIVSLTVTEGGYNLDAVTGEFNPSDEAVLADLRPGAAPRTVFGLVTEALARRRARGVPAFTILSCDNIQGNGHVSRRAFTAFARLREPELADWITAHVRFPNCMVDRITPKTTEADRAELSRRFGIDDRWPVLCEPFTQWVLEDDFSRRPAAARRRRRAARSRRGALRADEAAAAQRQPPGAVPPGPPGRVPPRARGHHRPAVRAVPARLHDRRGHPDAAAGSRGGPGRVREPAHRAVLQPRGARHGGPAVRQRLRLHPQVPAARHQGAARRRRAGHPVRGRRRRLGPLRRGHRRERRAARA